MSTAKHPVQAAEMVEGPYYGNGCPPRSDIREGRQGVSLALEVHLVDIHTEEPARDLRVDLWHPDATGRYSGYPFDPDQQPADVTKRPPVNNDSFLRGAQVSGADGVVRFMTIVPGWYASRAPHMHLKVFRGDTCILTTQLFLPRATSEEVYATPAYVRQVAQDTYNSTDTVLAKTQASIDGCWIDVSPASSGFQGRAVLGIDPHAESIYVDPPPGFRPPLGGIAHDKPVR